MAAMWLAWASGCAPAAPSSPSPLAVVPTPAATATASATEPPDVRWRADLELDDGRWSITYRFPEPQSALLFDTAHGNFRTTHWSADAGVTLDHLHGLDGMFFDEPTTTARLSIDVPARATEGTTAFVPFSNGAHAFWSGQLALLTVESREAADALGGDLGAWRGTQPPVHVRLSSDVPVVGPDGPGNDLEGIAHHGRGPFFYVGAKDDPGGLEDASMIVDPGLPAWVRSAFRTRMPEVQATLTERWSQSLPPPQLMLAWGGGEGPWSNRGRAEGRQIVMLVQGADYLKEDPRLLGDLVWFFAHEMTHLYQFAEGGDGAPWMIEGFADTMATDVLVSLGMWDVPALERRYWSVARECARELSRGPLEGGRGRVAYVCGDLVGVALISLLPEHDLAELWTHARGESGGRVTTARLLESARALGAHQGALEAVDAFVTGAHDDTDVAIRELLAKAGLEPKYVEGSLSSMRFPFHR